MKLYHSTSKENARSIIKEGLKPNGMGIIYLSPTLEKAKLWGTKAILEVETGNLKLTAFEDCKKWEVLCWADKPISPERIKVIPMNGSTLVKYCKHCGRINPLDTTRCISCWRNEFEPVELAPKWLVELERERQHA